MVIFLSVFQLAQDEGSPVRGFGVVEYESAEQAEAVLIEMDRTLVGGQEVRLSLCTPGTSGRSTLAALIAAQGMVSMMHARAAQTIILKAHADTYCKYPPIHWMKCYRLFWHSCRIIVQLSKDWCTNPQLLILEDMRLFHHESWMRIYHWGPQVGSAHCYCFVKKTNSTTRDNLLLSLVVLFTFSV